ncbi:hypothetical protein [Actinoplanes sp. NPDC051851]|uniref:hypothetical protein n=1 Tax=Actinoplanes sp. NPDC051851 TaxID=3154753 RepID=UPI003420444B
MTVLAHGIGSSSDLPLPLDLVLQAGAATVVVSFLIAAFWWRSPRLAGSVPRAVTKGWLRWPVLVIALYAGLSDVSAYALFIWLWVGLVPVSVVLGPVWRAVNPLRTIFGLLVRLGLPARGLRPSGSRAVWPAVAGLTAFLWFELVAPHRSDPLVVSCVISAYAVTQLTCAALRGEEWFARGDFVEVYSDLAGRLIPLGALAAPLRRGAAAFVAVWWGSTVFDSASGSPAWAGFVQRVGYAPLWATAGLLLVCAVVWLAVRWTAGRLDVTASLIPIAVGYTLAHYLSLLIVEGPRGVLLMLQQWGLAGGASWDVVPIPGVIAGLQVASILAGHVLGVIVAHDAALAADGSEDSPRPVLITLADELPLVLFMIGCTWTGLFLLFVR